MVTRRSLLQGSSFYLLASLLAGCGRQNVADLRITLLDGSVPVQLIDEFEQAVSRQTHLNFKAVEQLSDAFQQLIQWQRQADETASADNGGFSLWRSRPQPGSDLISLGDFWLAPAIQYELIRPLNRDRLSQWSQLPPRWQQLVQRDEQGQLSRTGQIWGAPYRWGSLMIVYRVAASKEWGWVPQDWTDLWRPELAQRLVLLDSARTVIGLTLKRLGASANVDDLVAIADLEETLLALHRQVKLYSSDAYQQPLLLRDADVAVGWSTDVVPLVKRDRRFAAVVPPSGTLLTADLWVQPAAAEENNAPGGDRSLATSEAIGQWIDFFWQLPNALQFSLLNVAASPLLLAQERSTLPPTLRNNSLLLPEPAIIDQSDFLYPLSPEVAEAYQALWIKVRQTG
mgnify:CR=1 FL=1